MGSETDGRMMTLEGLKRAAAAISDGLAVREALDRVLVEAARIAGASDVRILLVDRVSGVFRVEAAWGERASAMGAGAEVRLDSLSGMTVQTGEAVYSENVEEDPRSPAPYREVEGAPGIRTHLSLPIRRDRQVVGTFTINTREARRYSAEELECLTAYAGLAGIVIDHARLAQKEEERRAHLEAMRAVLEEIGRQVDVRRVMDLILDRVLQLGRADVGMMYLWEPKEGALVPRAWRGVGEWIATDRLRPGEGIAGTVARESRGLIVNSYRTSPLAGGDGREKTKIEAAMAEPLIHRGRLLGVLEIGRERQGDPFGSAEQESVRLFAAQAALAVEKARLVEELEEELTERQRAEIGLRRRTRQVEAVRAISEEITRELDTTTLLSLIAKRAMELLEANGGGIYLWDETEQVLVGRAAHGDTRAVLIEKRRLGEGIVGAIAARREGILENDYPRSPYVMPGVLDRVRLQAALGEPLLYRGRLLGVVQVGREPEGGPFRDEDQYTLRLFANQAAVAIENARLFAELNESYSRLQVLQEELVRVERLRALGQLSSGIVFKLNNVLAVVMGQVEELGVRVEDPKVQEGLALAASAAAEGVEIVRRLGGFVGEKKAGNLEPCDLSELVLEAVALTQPRWKDEAERQGRRIRVDAELDGVPAIRGRAEDIREVFTQLVLHAVDTMPEGGRITISGRHEAGFSDEHRDGWVVVTVRDTGTGIPETIRERIFEPFFGAKYLRGVGAGLASVREIVERHGGRVGVTALAREGTTFTLRLPATGDRPAAAVAEVEVPLVPGRRILVVDDNTVLLGLLAGLLKEAGLEVRAADSGRAALRLLEQGPADLVLTDLGMAGMTGWEVAEAVKARYPQTPVVILTGWGEQAVNEETRRRVFVDRILFKPIQRSVLLNMVAVMTAKPA